jgi:hypothetical protein
MARTGGNKTIHQLIIKKSIQSRLKNLANLKLWVSTNVEKTSAYFINSKGMFRRLSPTINPKKKANL